MTQYTVQPGDSPARVAGLVYGDQRRFQELINANGGSWQPGQVIDIPDITGTASPVITQAQFNAAVTGYQNGAPTYRGQSPSGPAVPTFSKPAVPNFGSAGAYDQRTGAGRGTSPWTVQPSLPAAGYGPNAAGTYDRGRDRSYQGTTGYGPGAQPSHQGAGYNANPALWPPLPGASGRSTGIGSGGLRVPGSVTAPNPYAGNGPNPMLYTTTSAAAGDPLMNALRGTMESVTKSMTSKPSNPDIGGQYGLPYSGGPHANGPVGPGTRTDGRYTYATGPGPSIPWSQQRGGYNQQYGGTMETYATFQALTAYAGGFDGSAKGNRTVLPSQITSRVANQIPLPPGYSDVTEFMKTLGYAPDASGNWIKQMPMVNQGYGGGNYGTATAIPSNYSGYTPYGYGGYGGYGGYSYPPASGGHTPNLGPAAGGLVSWRITA